MITDLVPEHPMIIVILAARIATITTAIIITIIITIIIAITIRTVQVVQAADQEQVIQAAEVITETTAEDLKEIILEKTIINKSCEIRERIK